jgi:hypothetical protein
MLLLIEKGLNKWIEKAYLKCCAKRYPAPVENLEKDENVKLEEERIS